MLLAIKKIMELRTYVVIVLVVFALIPITGYLLEQIVKSSDDK